MARDVITENFCARARVEFPMRLKQVNFSDRWFAEADAVAAQPLLSMVQPALLYGATLLATTARSSCLRDNFYRRSNHDRTKQALNDRSWQANAAVGCRLARVGDGAGVHADSGMGEAHPVWHFCPEESAAIRR